MKENLIIVGDYNRDDFLYIAKTLHGHYNIYFLEFVHKGEIKSDNYKKWGEALFWGNYKSAVDLLDQIKPKIVLFYFIETFNHVALNVTCKYKSVRTYHIEHGIRNYEMLKANLNIIENQTKPRLQFIKRLKTFRSRLKGRLFFHNTIGKLPEVYGQFLKEYYNVRNSNTIFGTFSVVKDPLRIADCYISYSPKIFEFHQKTDHLPEGYPVHFIGCPSFDNLAGFAVSESNGKNILFIDNAFETQGLFGWNIENKVQFLEQLAQFAIEQDKKLWIKRHPYSIEYVYDKIKRRTNVTYIGDGKDFSDAISDSKIIIGFYSTLLMPFMAMNHTVCFSLSMHPAKVEQEVSDFLIKTGAIKRVDTWRQLEDAVANLDPIAREQKEFKEQFIRDWMYKFDGCSSTRLKNILLDEVS